MARGGLLSGATARGVLKHRGLGAPLQGRDATHRPQFTFRFERCVKRHKSGERRDVSSASRHCAPSRAAWTTQGSGAAGKSADPLMCNVRSNHRGRHNKVGFVQSHLTDPWRRRTRDGTTTPSADDAQTSSPATPRTARGRPKRRHGAQDQGMGHHGGRARSHSA